MNQLEIKIKKLSEKAIIPMHQNAFAAGADLYACIEDDEPITIKPGLTKMIKTGISMEIPEGFTGYIFARSGLACKKGLAPANKVGVIDPDYRGEIMVALYNQSNKDHYVSNGDRIAQIVFLPRWYASFVEVDELTNTDRGDGGFGSTGN